MFFEIFCELNYWELCSLSPYSRLIRAQSVKLSYMSWETILRIIYFYTYFDKNLPTHVHTHLRQKWILEWIFIWLLFVYYLFKRYLNKYVQSSLFIQTKGKRFFNFGNKYVVKVECTKICDIDGFGIGLEFGTAYKNIFNRFRVKYHKYSVHGIKFNCTHNLEKKLKCCEAFRSRINTGTIGKQTFIQLLARLTLESPDKFESRKTAAKSYIFVSCCDIVAYRLNTFVDFVMIRFRYDVMW